MKALLLIDIQNDFVEGGALAVPNGREIIEIANRVMPKFDLIVATQDYHPADHLSFASQHPGKQVYDQIELDGLPQTLWPDHCIEGTRGAEFVSDLNCDRIDRVFPKGTNRKIDSYSGFFDNGHRQATGLGDYLKSKGVNELFLMGLATDYCVKFSVLDAIELGFKTIVMIEGCRAVNINPDDSQQALNKMRAAGAILVGTCAKQ